MNERKLLNLFEHDANECVRVCLCVYLCVEREREIASKDRKLLRTENSICKSKNSPSSNVRWLQWRCGGMNSIGSHKLPLNSAVVIVLSNYFIELRKNNGKNDGQMLKNRKKAEVGWFNFSILVFIGFPFSPIVSFENIRPSFCGEQDAGHKINKQETEALKENLN